MYLGRIVERGLVDEVLRSPKHPYTQALLSAVPSPRLDEQSGYVRLSGEMPSPANPPRGCHFHPRCAQAMDVCRTDYPGTRSVTTTQAVCCHLYQ
jgi:peptide/nickel transport system ATP-binding protein